MKNAVLKDVYRAQDVILPAVRGYGEKVSQELPKLQLRVRFSLPAPITQNAAAELLLYRQSYRRPYGLGQIALRIFRPRGTFALRNHLDCHVVVD